MAQTIRIFFIIGTCISLVYSPKQTKSTDFLDAAAISTPIDIKILHQMNGAGRTTLNKQPIWMKNS